MFVYTNLTAANAADVDRFLESVDMQATAYTLDNTTSGTQGARNVTVTVTAGATADTLGDLLVTGTDLSGQTITETITPVAGSTVSGSKWFVTVTSAITAGWVIDAVEGTADTITIGMGSDICVLDGAGVLGAVVVNSTAAGTVVLEDSKGTIATLKSSIAEGVYTFNVNVSTLKITEGAASDVTIVHTGTIPKTYALS